ncbi:MAG: multidrug effflux MFS transporter [Proteobacteria bacterium]|nr:multidrug effflux MFS transporter [Pseudomonadota bacterium]
MTSKKIAEDYKFIPYLMVLASALCAMSTTILTPALPFIAHHFDFSNDASQKILSMNLLGVALSGLLYGALSESLGRRLLFLMGFLLFSLCAFLSFLAESFNVLWSLQILQGCGVGCAAVLPLAVIRDVYSGKRAAYLMSIFGILMALSPALSPLVGGIIIEALGWKFIFLFLSSVGVIIGIGLFYGLPETHPQELRHPVSLLLLLKNYARLLKNTKFLRFAVLPWFSFGGLWVYSSTAPFVFIENCGLTPVEYGKYPIITILGVIIGNVFVNRFISLWELLTFLKIGSISLLSGIFGLLLATGYNCKDPMVYASVMFFYCFGFGSLWSASLSMAMDHVSHGKGYGAALIRSGQLLSASLGVMISGLLYEGSFILPGLFILACAIAITLLVWTTSRSEISLSE